jgi:uncharacterized RDD family membrane protein YckC
MRTDTLTLRTPEGIVFSLPLAGPLTRFLAFSVDLAVVTAAGSVLGTVLGSFRLLSLDLAQAFTVVAYFAISIGYGIGTEWLWRGQTIGKRLLRLRVVDEHGLRLQPSQIVVRNLLRFVDLLPAFYLVGGAAMALSRRAQRLGDIAAGTVVVRALRPAEPDLDQILAGKFNSLREHPHLAARLRQQVGPEEAALALRALLRRDTLDPEARVTLFRDLAAHFRRLVEFPPDAVEGIADEQYVRNVVDVVFRR